jgi:hypothetical protein
MTILERSDSQLSIHLFQIWTLPERAWFQKWSPGRAHPKAVFYFELLAAPLEAGPSLAPRQQVRWME